MATPAEFAALTGKVDEGIYKGTISNWVMVTPNEPDPPWFVIAGIPDGNPTKLRRTSKVVAINPERTRVRTLNSIYDLDTQLPELDASYALPLLSNLMATR